MDFTALLGNEINVVAQPRVAQRDYHAFAGADGLLSMFHGFRGYTITVTGRNWGTGGSYQIARGNAETGIVLIESYLAAFPDTYTFMGISYFDVVFERFELIPDGTGKAFHSTAEGYVVYDFIAQFRSLN